MTSHMFSRIFTFLNRVRVCCIFSRDAYQSSQSSRVSKFSILVRVRFNNLYRRHGAASRARVWAVTTHAMYALH